MRKKKYFLFQSLDDQEDCRLIVASTETRAIKAFCAEMDNEWMDEPLTVDNFDERSSDICRVLEVNPILAE